ncbi:hypothetical protein A8950_3061 [Dongia mobilis]|uniref:Uncharacterized protein n=1 Tax=Dongia mobilis TaxID=578943 RepID=A0A4R6WN00_9PROT|nr:hypothetical protein [Dongia mobilis]TDQ80529.1 hypothetical protein A8950_3061 [Dongia mobilis]
MTLQSPAIDLASAAKSTPWTLAPTLTEIVELRRERLLDGGDEIDLVRRQPAAARDAAQAWQRLARQRLGIGTALFDLDNALAYAIDVDAEVILYRVIVARELPRQLELGALFAAGEVAAARFAANGILEWMPIRDAQDVADARRLALRQGATPLGRVFALTSLPAEGGLRLMASGGGALTLDLVPPSVDGRHYPQARRFAWSEPDTPMSYGFGAPAAEQMPGGLAALFTTPWQ